MMFAVAFDLVVAETVRHHPKSSAQAYVDIGAVLRQHNFRWIQDSVYVTDNEDLSDLFRAIHALKALPWFPPCVRDIRAFRVEMWSDFTSIVKEL